MNLMIVREVHTYTQQNGHTSIMEHRNFFYLLICYAHRVIQNKWSMKSVNVVSFNSAQMK